MARLRGTEDLSLSRRPTLISPETFRIRRATAKCKAKCLKETRTIADRSPQKKLLQIGGGVCLDPWKFLQSWACRSKPGDSLTLLGKCMGSCNLIFAAYFLFIPFLKWLYPKPRINKIVQAGFWPAVVFPKKFYIQPHFGLLRSLILGIPQMHACSVLNRAVGEMTEGAAIEKRPCLSSHETW